MLDARRGGAKGVRLYFHDFEPTQASFEAEVLDGLARPQKTIPCRFLYDARGSQLFDAICQQPEYYPTRTELEILKQNADEIAELAGPDVELIELGSGSSAKVGILLDALDRPAAYVPIDISRDHLLDAAERVASERPALDVHAICADYSEPVALPSCSGESRLAFFPGSTIGNFKPKDARAFLASWSRQLGPGSTMLIGVDLRKSKDVLDAAYDDDAGVTAAFSLNLLARCNRELGANFDIDAFRHDAQYLKDEGRVAIHIRATSAQEVAIGGRTFGFAEGETIHIEDSWKYTIEGFQELAAGAGYQPAGCWTDPERLFSVHLLEAA